MVADIAEIQIQMEGTHIAAMDDAFIVGNPSAIVCAIVRKHFFGEKSERKLDLNCFLSFLGVCFLSWEYALGMPLCAAS